MLGPRKAISIIISKRKFPLLKTLFIIEGVFYAPSICLILSIFLCHRASFPVHAAVAIRLAIASNLDA